MEKKPSFILKCHHLLRTSQTPLPLVQVWTEQGTANQGKDLVQREEKERKVNLIINQIHWRVKWIQRTNTEQ